MQCRDFREIADSYLSDELLIETNHDVISHLEACADCRREMSARREVRAIMRAGFVNAPKQQITREFAERLKSQLKSTAMKPGRGRLAIPSRWWSSVMPQRRLWLALAACLVVATGFGLFVLRQKLAARSGTDQAAGSQQEPSRSTQQNPRLAWDVASIELAKSAVGDHRDCAIQFRLAEKPIDLNEAGQKYDPAYLDLQKTVFSETGGLPAQVDFVEAHSCVFEGRRFAHIVLKYRGRIVSLLVTNLSIGNEVNPRWLHPQTEAQHQAIAGLQIGGYQISCFETARHAVFVVSDLPEGDNLAVAQALAPAVIVHLSRAEIAI